MPCDDGSDQTCELPYTLEKVTPRYGAVDFTLLVNSHGYQVGNVGISKAAFIQTLIKNGKDLGNKSITSFSPKLK